MDERISINYYDDYSVKIWGYKILSGKQNKACLVAIVSVETGVEIFRATTDKNGKYEFTSPDLKPGIYEVRFYGSGNPGKLKPDGDWERIEIQQSPSIRYDNKPPDYTIANNLDFLIG